ncbi:hypothetical protein EDF81_1845 [Enterobacter sp. BIGb0383]|uniref:hypothetical protein n=1 Tax=unclassified Enterobacter TaxID=2608935 RepID=UPI000F49AD18|nr:MULTISPECIES: hypothetical protein [unclassified Enterobacter]ROP59061.1 hypothetical protein EDF81_1845 [Enterobacter sp. BIGb0383]ROS09473.1 hypothetical protein EC848_2995 [Enterobacter sp. BIGb0359]
MIQIVLFLIAVTLAIFIWRQLGQHKDTVLRVALIAFTVIAVIIAAILGWSRYSAWQNTQKSHQDIVAFFEAYDSWADNAARQAGETELSLSQLEGYARDLAAARGHSYWYSNRALLKNAQGEPQVNDTAVMALEKPLDGIRDIKISYNRGLASHLADSAVRYGYRGGWLVKIYTLDMRQEWDKKRHRWVAAQKTQGIN